MTLIKLQNRYSDIRTLLLLGSYQFSNQELFKMLDETLVAINNKLNESKY